MMDKVNIIDTKFIKETSKWISYMIYFYIVLFLPRIVDSNHCYIQQKFDPLESQPKFEMQKLE